MSVSEENLVLARRITAAYEQGEFAILHELYAPDHVMHQHWRLPLPLAGSADQPLLDRYEQTDANARADTTDLQVTVDEQFTCGDWVVSVLTSRWTHARCGTAVTERAIFLDRFADGKVVETWVAADRLGLLQQLGAVGPSPELFALADLTV